MRALRLAAAFLFVSSASFAQYRIAVWIPGWDTTNVLSSLQLHAGSMSESNPVWYQINSDGTIAKSTSVAEDSTWRAAMTGTQILPTIQNTVNGSFDPSVALSVISAANRDAHAENIRQLVVNQAYDGIDIDYEDLPYSSRPDFTAFITSLANKLHSSGKTLSVTVSAKTSDSQTWNGPGGDDYAAIGQVADWVKLMCYDYSWSTSAPGPIAPLSWIDQVVTFAQSQIASPKIIVGLPWYGYDWGTSGVGVTYQQAFNTALANNVTIGYDANGEATYTYSTHTVYFQDANSYSRKTDLITQKHAGVGGFAHWRIAAEDPNIWTRVASLKNGTSNTTSLTAPSGLQATAVSASQVNLTWSDNSASESGFGIERCSGAGCTSFVQIAQVGANVTSFSDTSLASSTTYSYRARAFDATTTSSYSNTSTATTAASTTSNAPAAPTSLTAAAPSAHSIQLAWTDNASNETGFRVERCTGSSCTSFALLTTLAPNATSFVDSGLDRMTYYSYRVSAVNGAASSAYSNIAGAKTLKK